MRPLPPELVGHIVGCLRDSVPDLRTCARVCKAWLEPSRNHLFYRVSTNYPNPCITLHQIIQQSPRIALHVRELEFSDEILGDMPLDDIFQLLRSFTRLCKLELFFQERTSLIPGVRKCLRDILALPSLVHLVAILDFYKEEHLIDLFQPHLKRLFASIVSTTGTFEEPRAGKHYIQKEYSGTEDGREPEAALEREPCRLSHLKLLSTREGPEFLEWFLGAQSVVDVSNLCSLIASVDEEDMHLLVRLAGSIGSSLERLSIEALDCDSWGASKLLLLSLHVFMCADSSCTDTFPDDVDWGHKPNLKVLHLKVEFCPQGAKCLTSLLSNLAAPNLEQISFQLEFLSSPPWKKIEMDMVWDDWREVFRIFDSQPLTFLRRFDITPPSGKTFRQKFAEDFPSLTSKGIVEFIGGQ
jgi:hypothetical protein